MRIVSISMTRELPGGRCVGVAEREGIKGGGILSLKVSADEMRLLGNAKGK
jgi:hypothetical protein